MRRLGALLLFLGMAGGAMLTAHAGGLQVSPVSLTLAPNRQAAALWVTNTGQDAMNVQARVFAWTQRDGQDALEPSSGAVLSPPMAHLAPGERQLVRVVRTGPPPSGPSAVQQAYRVVVDELPLQSAPADGLNFVMRYSVPVFVEPAGDAVAPALTWQLEATPEGRRLVVRNDGGASAQLAELVQLGDDGTRTVVHAGLMGYVLPGAQRHWPLAATPASASSAGRWEAMVNGERKVVDIEAR